LCVLGYTGDEALKAAMEDFNKQRADVDKQMEVLKRALVSPQLGPEHRKHIGDLLAGVDGQKNELQQLYTEASHQYNAFRTNRPLLPKVAAAIDKFMRDLGTHDLHRLRHTMPVAYFGYDWDAASRIIAVQREAGTTIYYSYDDADRLTGERWYNGGSQIYGFAWDYDPVGNRTKEAREHEGTVGYYTYNAANALTQEHLLPADERSYWRYDERGNCVEAETPLGTTYYTYNSRDLVTSIRWRTGVMNYFHYDAQGRRYAITESAGTTYLTYDQDGLFTLAERDASGNLLAGNTRGYGAIGGIGDRAMGEVHSGATTSRQYDCAGLTGNNVAFVSQSAQVTGRLEYNAFGELLRYEPPTEGLRYGYSGPAWRFLPDDPDHKTWITKTRWYDAKVGRFGQRDQRVSHQVGDYPYAKDRPTSAVDPTGRESREVWIGNAVAQACAAGLFSVYVNRMLRALLLGPLGIQMNMSSGTLPMGGVFQGLPGLDRQTADMKAAMVAGLCSMRRAGTYTTTYPPTLWMVTSGAAGAFVNRAFISGSGEGTLKRCKRRDGQLGFVYSMTITWRLNDRFHARSFYQLTRDGAFAAATEDIVQWVLTQGEAEAHRVFDAQWHADFDWESSWTESDVSGDCP
jgi:YD repeat-containing protein